MEYPLVGDSRTAKDRFTNEEKRALDRLQNDIYSEVRLAAEAHRQVCCMCSCHCKQKERICMRMIRQLQHQEYLRIKIFQLFGFRCAYNLVRIILFYLIGRFHCVGYATVHYVISVR